MMLYVGFQLFIAITTTVTFFGSLVKITVTQKKLQSIITQKGAIQAGAAIDVPHRREREGFSGSYHVFRRDTKLIMFADEDRLLEIRVPRYNERTLSNAQEQEGYVNVIYTRKETVLYSLLLPPSQLRI